MTGSPSKPAVPLDASVGSLDNLVVRAPFAGAAEAPIRVTVSGDSVSTMAAMALADDLRTVVEGFVARPEPTTRERIATRPPRDDGPGSDVQVAIHGLQLSPEAEERLLQTIRELIHTRATEAGAGIGESELAQ